MNRNQLEFFSDAFHSPWLEKQVESHLFLGNYRHRIIYVGLIYFFILVWGLLGYFFLNYPFTNIFEGPGNSGYLVIIFLVPLTKYNYARSVYCWVIVKCFFVAITFLFTLLGFIGSVFMGSKIGLYQLILGLIWFPSLELLPNLTEKQRFITLFRLIFSIPMIHLLIINS